MNGNEYLLVPQATSMQVLDFEEIMSDTASLMTEQVSQLLRAIFTNPHVIITFAAVILLYFFTRSLEKRRKNLVVKFKQNKIKQNSKNPYMLNLALLTMREASFFRVLNPLAAKHQLHIFSKPRIADFVKVNLDKNDSKFYSYFNQIAMKHIDFLLCNQDFKPILGFEVDDSTHQRPKRVERDSFVDGLYKVIGLPVYHVYDWNNPDTIENYITSALPK
ncbi:MAG: DUF2726 domain-containing protein [Defluviitaleaceae bacterium]|nr:DUF2726 domain-containing protein [Defluviitaleaceae bacterium]